MALFKISKGKSENLPTNKVDGYCYVTINDHKFYVDYTKDDGTLDRFALNAVSADKWVTSRNLNGMVVNGTSNVVNYGTCSTAAATATKLVSCSNFALITGAEITVKFTVTNTAANPTLNVNNTGAKAIYYRGSAISAGYLAANRTYTFRYNGSQYDLVGDINTDTNTKVTQTVTTSNASYPLLLAPSGQIATTTTTSYFDSGVTLNPSTNTIAANISGSATTVPKALTSNGTTATTSSGYTYGVAGVTSGNRIYSKWYVNLDNGVTTLTDGMLIEIKIPVYGSRSGCAITIDNGTSFHPVIYGNSSIITSHFTIDDKILLMYDSTGNGNVYGTIDGSTTTYIAPIAGVWRIMNLYIDGNTYTSAYCDSPAFTTAKMANCSGYYLLPKSQIHVIIANTNTAASALTLNINAEGAKPIYINGIASSSSNYNLPRGSYLVYYDGTNYYFRTDGAITGDLIGNAATATKAMQDGNGNVISSTYLPLSAGESKKLTGPLGLTENINYGTSLPDDGFEGQLFFLEDEDKPSLPIGGIAGQVLVKNSSTDGDASWATNISGNAATATKLATTRKIGLSGGVTGTATNFDGSSNITIPVTAVDPSKISEGYTTKGFYINTHPENSPTIIPFINNDIAFLTKRGGSAVVKYDGTAQSTDISSVFDGSGSYWYTNPTNITTITIELTLHKAFTWTNTIYIDSGANGWRAKDMKIEVINTNYADDVWTTKGSVTNYGRSQWKIITTHTPSGASNAGGGFNKIRFTFSNWNNSTIFRIACLGVINYGSSGIREISLPLDGGTMYGGITPYKDNSYNLGSSSKKYANIYATNFQGNASTATKLATARSIALSGSVTGSATFDGSGNITIATTTNHSHNYAGSASAGGSANSAVKLDTATAGDSNTPVYFSGGKPVACTSLDLNTSGNAGTATKWATARNINGMSVQGDSNRFNYGICSTEAATAAKVVSCTGFALATGSEITVKFTVTNTASSPTLNVNNTGAKAIYYRGAAISAGYLAANRTYTFRYNGSQYDLVGDINTDTSTTTGTSNKTGTKLFLAGATSQATAPTTYSNSNVYIGTDNCLYSNNAKVATAATKTAQLTVSGWSSNQQTVSVSGITANNLVIVSPDPAASNYSAYTQCEIRCTAQAANKLTFTCKKTPSIAITVNIAVIS